MADDGGTPRAQYGRVLLKLSGEAFAPTDAEYGINTDATALIARQLAEVVDLGVQTAVVVGGGNIWRGRQAPGIDRNRADYMGMLATVMNALALQDALEKIHVTTRVQTAISMTQLAEPFMPLRARRHLEKGRVVIFAAGLGVPYFSTDTCAAQRALEIGADALLKGTKVDGVYTADPVLDASAKRFDEIEYVDVLKEGYQVMDATAISLCMENKLPIIVFNLREEGNIRRVVNGEPDRHARPLKESDDDRFQPQGRSPQDGAGGHPSQGRTLRDPHGPRDPRGAEPRHGGVLRHARAAEPARLHQRAGAPPAVGAAVRQRCDRGDREGDPVERPRHHPVERRAGDQVGVPPAHRGAAQASS